MLVDICVKYKNVSLTPFGIRYPCITQSFEVHLPFPITTGYILKTIKRQNLRVEPQLVKTAINFHGFLWEDLSGTYQNTHVRVRLGFSTFNMSV